MPHALPVDCHTQLEALVVGLWRTYEDDRCKFFKTKRLGGMGQEQHWPRTAVPVLLPTFYSALYISHRAACLINLKGEDG